LSRVTRRRLTLLAVSLLAFIAWLGKRDIATSHEARVGQTARVMAASGWPWDARPAEAAAIGVRPDAKGTYAVPRFDVPPLRVNPWLIPVLNGQIRLQKPPLPNWCASTLYRLTGGSSEFATRFVPAAMGAVLTFVIADLAGLILGRATTLIAGLAWAGTLTVVLQFREATADPYLAFFTTMAVWAWVRAGMPGQSRHRFTLIALFYASIGLGVLSKGPFIFLHVGLALAAYAWTVRRRPRAGVAAHLAGVALMLAIALPWPAYVLTHVENVADLWRMETTRGDGDRGIGYILAHVWEFPARSFELALPWIPFWLAGILAATPRRGARRTSRARRYAFPLVWYLATFAVFSFSPEKKSAYVLPVMPAQAMLVAIGLLAAGRLFKPSMARGLVVTQALIAAGFAVGAAVTIWRLDRGATVAIGVATILTLVMLATGVRRAFAWRVNRWFVPLGAGVVLASVAFAGLARAAQDNVRSAEEFAELAGDRLLPPANVLLPHLSAEASFYLPLGMRYDPAGTEVYDVVEPPQRKRFDASAFKPDLPHGAAVSAEIVQLPGEPPNARWRLVRIHVGSERAPERGPTTNPTSRATPP
jgi:4-amino-4-deoxy-L-arabinose transferase-like glycosyltransferase